MHEATGKPVIVTFDSGNLMPVAKTIRQMHPNAEIVIMADNDYPLLARQPFKNVGLEKAEEAAKAVDGIVLTPNFNDKEKEKSLTDWNDFSKERGKSVVATMLRSDLKQALNPQKAKSKTSEIAL
ncbi:MAG: hypothetical protein COB29_12750 [Sulfitobacter sp.]|nr:MAG: hypothetical protein COB29_12750 [Sulfitobacter sp.]